MRPFDSANTSPAAERRLTWYQVVAINHQAHPEWGTSEHVTALAEVVPEIGGIADLNGTTVHAMVT